MSQDAEFPSSEQLLAAIIDSSDDAIISKNLQSIVTSWNAGAQRIFGYTADEMVGQPINRLFPEDRQMEERVIIERLQRGERVEHFQTVRVHKDGQLIDVSLTISPVHNGAGKIVGASKIARDITDQVQAAKRLAEAHEALKRADQLKAEFLATLSHELRTPLSAIHGWIEILKDGADAAELKQGLDVIERNVRQQSKLIEDLLDLSRIEAGKVRLDVQPLDLSTTVLAALDSARPAAEAKGIALTTVFPAIEGSVMGDKNRIQQIVWNLLTNAIKFTPRDGSVQVAIVRNGAYISISVTDSGQGIAPEFLAHVFERFRQADSTTTRRHGGLGIGLAIVKHLTELHGGQVRVASRGLNLGATFTVELPLAFTHHFSEEPIVGKQPSPHSPTPEAQFRGLKVLVADDEIDSADVIRRILERRGATVRMVHSMREALDRFTTFAPDIVLSDIGMPEHDGFELLARLRQLPGGDTVPVAALTALARSEDRIRVLEAGFQLHLAKPVEAADLIVGIQNLAALCAANAMPA